jgi:hypothetical protein
MLSKEVKDSLVAQYLNGVDDIAPVVGNMVTVKFSLDHDIEKQIDSASNALRSMQTHYQKEETIERETIVAGSAIKKRITDEQKEFYVRCLRLLDAMFSMTDTDVKRDIKEIKDLLWDVERRGKNTFYKTLDTALYMSQDRHYLKLIGLGHLLDNERRWSCYEDDFNYYFPPD